MAETELSPRQESPHRFESFVYRWQQQPIQRTGAKANPGSPRSRKHQKALAADQDLTPDVSQDWQLALVDDMQQEAYIVPMSSDESASSARDSDPPPLLLTDSAFEDSP